MQWSGIISLPQQEYQKAFILYTLIYSSSITLTIYYAVSFKDLSVSKYPSLN